MILVNGDSFTYGDGLLRPTIESWPALAFGEGCKNIAKSGSSNPSIFRRTLEELYTNPGKYDRVVVGWSALDRFELSGNDGRAVPFLLTHNHVISKEILANYHNEYWNFKQFLIVLSSLNLHCRALGIELWCINVLGFEDWYEKSRSFEKFHTTFNLDKWNDTDILQEFLFISALIDQTAEIWLEPPSQFFRTTAGAHTISPKDPHPDAVGHRLIADKIRTLLGSRSV